MKRWIVVLGSFAVTCMAACSADTPSASDVGGRAGGVSSVSPLPVVSTVPGPTTAPPPAQPSVLLIGDSTLLAVRRYQAFDALQGFGYTYDAESCRTLGVPSCGDAPVPPNAVEAISAADGPFDVVVVMAGYDEWWTSFPDSFDAVMAAAVGQGAQHVIWLSYREGVGYTAPDGSTANEAFVRNNQTLRDKIASGQFPQAVLADWYGYSSPPRNWLSDDGIHLTPTGALVVADYISRVIAHVVGLPCAVPWQPGGPLDDPCPDPDAHGQIDDIVALYP
jgi:hypothetical protein